MYTGRLIWLQFEFGCYWHRHYAQGRHTTPKVHMYTCLVAIIVVCSVSGPSELKQRSGFELDDISGAVDHDGTNVDAATVREFLQCLGSANARSSAGVTLTVTRPGQEVQMQGGRTTGNDTATRKTRTGWQGPRQA